jgi:hypothetical protein
LLDDFPLGNLAINQYIDIFPTSIPICVSCPFIDTVYKSAKLQGEAIMCLKVQEPWSMPEDTAMVEDTILKEDSTFRLISGDNVIYLK